MTALIVTGCVLLALGLLLYAPVSAAIAYREGTFRLDVRYLFLRYGLSDRLLGKPSAKQKAKQTKKKRKKKVQPEEEEKDRGALFAAESVWTLVKSSRRGLRILRRNLVFSRVRVYIAVGGEDAAATALTFSHIHAAVLAALDVAGAMFVLRAPDVFIAPDFTGQDTRCDIALRVGIRPVHVLRVGGSILYHFLKHTMTARSRKNSQIKGGKQHERAASHH